MYRNDKGKLYHMELCQDYICVAPVDSVFMVMSRRAEETFIISISRDRYMVDLGSGHKYIYVIYF